MELCDRPSLGHRPQASQPDPIPAGQPSPWYMLHRDQGWEAACVQERAPERC